MTINDMNVLLAAVEIAVKRGAFSVLEIQQVGEVSSKLAAFLQAAKEQAEQATAEQAAAEQSPENQEQPVAESTGA